MIINKTQEIYEWYRNCIATGSVCLFTQNYYLKNYLYEYNEATKMYSREKMDQKFPEVK